MRLRYLHLPNYGILKDLRVTFERETIFSQPGELHRRGDLHFVVGLNGTGKSSLLRAIFATFRWLEDAVEVQSLFPFPVTLVYDLPSDDHAEASHSCLFHHSGQFVSDGLFFAASESVDEAEHGDWDGWVEWLRARSSPDKSERPSGLLRTDELQGNNLVREGLPNPLLVYTSGSLAVWQRARAPELPQEDLEAMASDLVYDDRPRGWDVYQELASADVELEKDDRNSLRQRLDPNIYATQSRCLLLEPLDMKLAAITVGLSVAAREVTRASWTGSRENWRAELLSHVQKQRVGERPPDKCARTLLNEVDWWWPTHLSIEYRPSTSKLNPQWHAQQLALCALADEVVRQPLDRMQMVISLGPRRCQIAEAVKDAFGDRDVPLEVKDVIDRVEGASTGAQAVMRTLCTLTPVEYESTGPQRALWEVFCTLHSWRTARLIDDVTVTVKRVTTMKAIDGDDDDVIVTWEDLSDGEQELLGRMSLLLLLNRRHGSMLLLDEPETHFNDSWKREIIDIVDDNILKTTSAHVLVATHTSIALTDAFASEIIRLIRSNGKAEFKPVSFATFGAEPGRIMLNVFDMPEAIGSRAEEVLRILLEETNWRGKRSLLEHVVAEIGGGWPRARLREMLEEL